MIYLFRRNLNKSPFFVRWLIILGLFSQVMIRADERQDNLAHALACSIAVQKTLIDGDWLAANNAGFAKFFPGWPESPTVEAAPALRYFLSGALVLPRADGVIAHYNVWLDAAILVKWRSVGEPVGLSDLRIYVGKGGPNGTSSWLASKEPPFLAVPAAFREFDKTWQAKGLDMAPSAADAPLLIERSGAGLLLLLDGHRRLNKASPSLHQAMVDQKTAEWVAHIDPVCSAMGKRVLDLHPVVRDQLCVGSFWPDDEHRGLIAMWSPSAPGVVVLLRLDDTEKEPLVDVALFAVDSPPSN